LLQTACARGAATQVINNAAKTWGLECLRYEIRDILPPPGIVRAMELQAEAERRKRAQVLESEGVRQATINESEARRVSHQPAVRVDVACLAVQRPEGASNTLPSHSITLASCQRMQTSAVACLQESAINNAIGEAETISRRSQATADGLRMIAGAISAKAGSEAVSMTVAQQYVEAFSKIAQKGNTMIVPADAGNVAAMVTQATSVFQRMAAASQPQGAQQSGQLTSPGDKDAWSAKDTQESRRDFKSAAGTGQKDSQAMSSVADSPILQSTRSGMRGDEGVDRMANAPGGVAQRIFSLQGS
jgi:C-terminal region of band_7